MPEHVYLWVEGAKSGKFPGEVEIQKLERKGSIECLSYEHGLTLPYDVHSASPSGRRQYSAIKFTKWIDQTTPLFLQACFTNEAIKSAVFKFYRPAKTGEEEHFFTVSIKGGCVVSARQIVHDVMDHEFKEYKPMEEVSFTFQHITWDHVVGKKQATDDWSAKS